MSKDAEAEAIPVEAEEGEASTVAQVSVGECMISHQTGTTRTVNMTDRLGIATLTVVTSRGAAIVALTMMRVEVTAQLPEKNAGNATTEDILPVCVREREPPKLGT
jgi:hypothetical protein